MFDSKPVAAHYGIRGLQHSIDEALIRAGKDLTRLAVDDLAPVDEFHSRGRNSTLELAALSPIAATDRVLDVGCGLGGSARHLANEYRCRVEGVDLTREYIDVAIELTCRVGLGHQVQFQNASALDLPFQENSFEVVWTEHAQMNIEDKDQFYAEIARVLKPNGRLLFHDIFLGVSEPTFPLPWAEDPSISSLATETDAKQSMLNAGLQINRWEHKNVESLAAFAAVLAKIETDGLPPLGIHLLMGDTAKQKLVNYVNSMKAGKISVALGVAQTT